MIETLGRPVDDPRSETQRLGSYEIVRKLARGGMAELFLARTVGPEGFEKLVVLKKILPNHSENPKFVRLFLDEAKLAATLDHPHIAHVYDMGKVDGHYFFTMEYVHGQDVRTVQRRAARIEKRFPIDHAVQIARNVAAALHYAHERRRGDGTLLDIVHRDVSPSNIIVSYDGSVKLVDFGVAKAATSTVKTRTGTLKGKISYMSPEQAKGAPIDRRSDIFALGIVLWELITTQRLFKADNDLATIQMIINSKPTPPTQLRPDCPNELERILLRALANNIDERYQTAEQMQLDLDELAREQKLNQSTVSLRTFMHEMFADEIKAWSLAKASGQTLTEHMVERATEMTTPVSESDVYSLDDYDDGDDDDEDGPSTMQPTNALTSQQTQQISVPPPPNQTGPVRVLPSIVVDQAPTIQMETPVPGAQREEMIMPGEISARMPQGEISGRMTPFPIAPAEWRQPEPTLSLKNPERTKLVLIGSSIALGLIVLAAIALASDRSKPAAQVNADEAAATDGKVEMKAQPNPDMAPTPVEAPVETPPPPTETPPAEAKPIEAKPDEATPSETDAPPSEEKKPKRTRKPSVKSETRSGAGETKSTTKPATTTTTKPTTTTTKPATTTTTKPTTTTTKPATTTTTKPPPTTTTKPATTTTTKPATTKKPYDPNSPLAPP